MKEQLPHELMIIFNYVKTLGSSERPNYAYILQNFENFLISQDVKNFQYDWILDQEKENPQQS